MSLRIRRSSINNTQRHRVAEAARSLAARATRHQPIVCAATVSCLLVGLTVVSVIALIAPTEAETQRMSFHNRLLLNRAAVSGLRALEVMLLVTDNGLTATSARVERLGGRVQRADEDIRYVRAEVPIEKLTDLVADDRIEAYQISSMSKASWYRDGPPQENAELFREYERVIPNVRRKPVEGRELPFLSATRARESGYTADEDVGLTEWFQKHPTYDGRGVTIAILESALPEFRHPTLHSAKTLDGREIPKLAGILSAIGPDQGDTTRVELSTEVHATHAWQKIGDRTYAVPRPGRYRFGLFRLPAAVNLIHEYGVLREEASGDIWVDANGNADFRDETPVTDANEELDVRALKLTHPEPVDLSFVVAAGRAPHTVHIYTSRGGHQAMTLSVAAGSKTEDGLAYGVAPGARVLLVRRSSTFSGLHTLLESYLDTIKRPDVDLIGTAAGIVMVPDTAADFTGLFFRRMVAVHGKPIFNSAGNMQLWLNSVASLGDVFSVGGSIGPQTFAALYGGGTLGGLMLHPVGASGPSLDGALKPDFLAPVHRIAADVWNDSVALQIPKNAPTAKFPPGYQISCCTSASGPYAAGVAALLLSAAKQEHVSYTVPTLGRALRVGARFLAGWPSHQQGNGVLDVNAAWRELKRPIEIPRIQATAKIVHPLAPYAAHGHKGVGIFEREGWSAGMRGRRTIHFQRQSGADSAVTYRLSWTGNDGTFSTQRSLTLPLNQTTSLPVAIALASTGAHSAILNLHDPATDAIVFRTQATLVATERFDAPDATLRLSGSAPLMRTNTHYLTVPEGVATLSIELKVVSGSVRASIVPSHGLYPNYYGHAYPLGGRTFPKGTYHLAMPNPAAGTWTISVSNTSARTEDNPELVSTDEAEYALTARLLRTSLRPASAGHGVLEIDVENRGGQLTEPVLETSVGTLKRHHGELLPAGLPNQFEIDVPEGAATLALHLRGVDTEPDPLELYLYDCSSGECFSDNFTLPAAKEQRLVVRRPRAGRWIAAVNTAPFPTKTGKFVLDEIITTKAQRHASSRSGPRQPGAKWTETVKLPSAPSAEPGHVRVLLCELIDGAMERDEARHPWENRKRIPKLRDRPSAVGTMVYRFD
ncbi:MAG: S8 family serine peptidase [Luteitalea sp.]|nr:S8 family serine peptidase [Luteitalea sp.]